MVLKLNWKALHGWLSFAIPPKVLSAAVHLFTEVNISNFGDYQINNFSVFRLCHDSRALH